jgi:predicted MPP superfamily phosphohydrolase
LNSNPSFLIALLRTLSFLLVVLAIDLYFFQALKTVTAGWRAKVKSRLYIFYWSLTGYAFLIFLVNLFYPIQQWGYWGRIYGFALIVVPMLCKVPAIILLLLDDLIRAIKWGLRKIKKSDRIQNPSEAQPEPISRLRFLSLTGTMLAAIPFGTMIYGMIKSGFDIRVRKITLRFPNLPEGFNGFRFVQLSDIHSGSFIHSTFFEEALKTIENLKPEAVFFTGDLVNNTAEEAERFASVWSMLKAPMGVYSTLGNHDYGDYVVWPSEEEKAANFERLIKVHENAGWKLLRNEHHILKRNQSEIALIGVENWGSSMRFPKKGDVHLATKNMAEVPFRILLSHDPSHWDAQIRPNHPDIDLMLSGHTHGMQFGIEIPGFKWSPSKYFYKQWAGAYREKQQVLYVNRGLGFLGYPGRVGILPEITEITLERGELSLIENS